MSCHNLIILVFKNCIIQRFFKPFDLELEHSIIYKNTVAQSDIASFRSLNLLISSFNQHNPNVKSTQNDFLVPEIEQKKHSN